MIRFLKDKMSSVSSDLYEEVLKPNKSHTNRIIQIVLSKTAFKTMVMVLAATRETLMMKIKKSIIIRFFGISTFLWLLNLT